MPLPDSLRPSAVRLQAASLRPVCAFLKSVFRPGQRLRVRPAHAPDMQVCLLPGCLHSGSSETSQISLPRDPHLTECEHHSLDAQGRRLRVSSGSSLSHPRLPIARLSFLTRRIPAPPVSPLCTVGVGCKIPSSLPSPGQGSSWAPPPPPPPSHPLRSQAESDHTVFLLGSAFLPVANRKEAKICALPPLPSAGTTLLLLAAWAPRSP